MTEPELFGTQARVKATHAGHTVELAVTVQPSVALPSAAKVQLMQRLLTRMEAAIQAELMQLTVPPAQPSGTVTDSD